MTIVPITFKKAAQYVADLHRHNKRPTGMKFCLALEHAGALVGVAVVGRPSARAFDDGLTCEVTRTCTDGTDNANSCLYGAAWRTAKGMGYRRIVTYTQADESGASLKAAGFMKVKDLPARAGWAESSGPKYKAMRDPVGNGGVPRTLWEIRASGKVAA